MSTPLLIARTLDKELFLLPAMANRHGLITGATGTGKTVTLQKLAESLSEIGVPVFMADVKGDLTGVAQEGTPSEKLLDRLKNIGITDWTPHNNPVVLWDIFGEKGHPVRATVSDLGPLLLARLLNLNDVQSGVLNIIFRIADDRGLLLLDFKDLRAITQYIGDNAKSFQNQYGNISSASVGAIQRGLLTWATGCRTFLWRADAGYQGLDAHRQQRERHHQYSELREALPDAEALRRQPAVDAL